MALGDGKCGCKCEQSFTFYQEVPMSDSMKALISKKKIVFAVKTMRIWQYLQINVF